MKPFTQEEAISALQTLAKRWPKDLWLFSWSGSLCVMKGKKSGNKEELENSIVTTIDIPSDGGDP